ncbi:hypothetical protein F4861DRAFT_541170 [Xylaria intraflava]|nr:hypothetical protein F4861DRAFT_541170 [Xylaria intraflava]
MEPFTIQAWEAVINEYGGWRLNLVEERLDKAAVESRGTLKYDSLNIHSLNNNNNHHHQMLRRASARPTILVAPDRVSAVGDTTTEAEDPCPCYEALPAPRGRLGSGS